MAIPRNLFVYWENLYSRPTPPFIQYCLDSFQRCGEDVNVVFVNRNNIDKLLDGSGLHDNWRIIQDIPQKVDCLRVAIVRKYGGMYVDADTVITRPLGHLFENDNDINLLKWTFNNRLINAYFTAQRGSVFLTNVLNQINTILANECGNFYNKCGGVYLGENVFEIAAQTCPYTLMPRETFIPYEFPFNVNCWYGNEQIDYYIRPETVAIALNLSQYDWNFRMQSVESHMVKNSLFGSVFRYSEKCSPLMTDYLQLPEYMHALKELEFIKPTQEQIVELERLRAIARNPY